MIPLSKPIIGKEEIDNVNEVLNSGMIAQGPKVKELESKFSKYTGAKYAVAVNSGTAALHTSLYSLGIKPGDEVITVPFTFVATANSIVMQGAKPVFVDIDGETFNIDSGKIEGKITEKTKAILAVDLYGHPSDYKAIKKIANKHNLCIIEDAAQSVGAELDGVKAGCLGDVSAFSFYATKNLMSGEGGILTTDNPEVAELAKRFRHHGQSEKTNYEYYDLGYNYRMMDIQAGIALAQLDKIEDFTKKRIQNANYLTKGLSKFEELSTPLIKGGVKHVFHQYTIKVDENVRDGLLKYLRDNGVGCGVYYPKPLHLHPHFAKYGYSLGDFPVSEKIAKSIISLPVHPLLDKDELDIIINKVGEFFENN